MKDFSLLNQLASDLSNPKPAAVEIAPVDAGKRYQVYILEGLDETRKVCIPVENVEGFDAFINENPERISDINLMVENFAAVIMT